MLTISLLSKTKTISAPWQPLWVCYGADVVRCGVVAPLVFPVLVRIGTERGVVVSSVARDLFAEEGGALVGFVGSAEFHFGHDEAVVVAVELVHFVGVVAHGHEPTCFVHDARFAEAQQRKGFFVRDALLKLVAGEAAVERRTFYGEVALVVAEAYAHRAAAAAADVALDDVAVARGEFLVRTCDEKFAFYFYSHFVFFDLCRNYSGRGTDDTDI